MLSFLLALLPDFLKVWLGFKANEAESLGKSEQKAADLQADLNIANAEAKAAANAPQGDKLITALKNSTLPAILLFLFLASCADKPIPAPICPQMYPFTDNEKAEIAANLSMLPLNSPLMAMGNDWAKLRCQVDACQHPESKACQQVN